jgi:hypothetical protein
MGMASDLDAFADPGNIGVPGAKADVAGAQLRITASSGRHGRRRERLMAFPSMVQSPRGAHRFGVMLLLITERIFPTKLQTVLFAVESVIVR